MIQLRTFAYGVVGFILTILIAVFVSWWLLPLLIPAYIFGFLILLAYDIRDYFVGLIALAQNPRAFIADKGLLTQRLPFYVRPFADYLIKKYADGDYDELLERKRKALQRRLRRN